MEEFFSACKDGDLQRVKAIIEAKDPDETAQKAGLDAALSDGWEEIVSYLLSLKPDIPIDSWSVNHATYGGVGVYSQLHQKHPNIINFSFGHLQSALHNGARRNDVALLSYILEVGAGEPGANPDWILERFTRLEWAAFNDRVEAAQCLLIHGASKQTNALQFAASSGRFKMVQALFDAGVDENYVCRPGEERYDMTTVEYKSPLQAAVEGYRLYWGGHYKKLWEGEPERKTEHEYLEVVKLLLKKGADMYLRDDKGENNAWLEAQKAGAEKIAEIFSKHQKDNEEQGRNLSQIQIFQ